MEKSQLAVTKCHSYDIEEVQTAVDVCMNALGGLDSFIDPGDRCYSSPTCYKPIPLMSLSPHILLF